MIFNRQIQLIATVALLSAVRGLAVAERDVPTKQIFGYIVNGTALKQDGGHIFMGPGPVSLTIPTDRASKDTVTGYTVYVWDGPAAKWPDDYHYGDMASFPSHTEEHELHGYYPEGQVPTVSSFTVYGMAEPRVVLNEDVTMANITDVMGKTYDF